MCKLVEQFCELERFEAVLMRQKDAQRVAQNRFREETAGLRVGKRQFRGRKVRVS